jgi:UDP-glucose:(heptosyl)LPS alpha-1,3-glucosyltransferase
VKGWRVVGAASEASDAPEPPDAQHAYTLRGGAPRANAIHIVQIAPAISRGSGVEGVAFNLEREFLARGATVERFTAETAGRSRRRTPKSALGMHLERARNVVWFSTMGTARARRFLAERPGAISICHNDALVGDIYVNHGLLQVAMRARGNYFWRMVRNPLHLFTAARDRVRYRGRAHRAVVALTDHEADLLVSTYGRVRPPIHVIPNGVDTQMFRPPTSEERAEARAEIGLPASLMLALFVGHEFERKGLPLAIEALRDAPGVGLIVVGGTTAMIRQAEELAHRHGVADRVAFVGRRSKVVPFYHAADVFVLPSYYESSGLVFLEALACGLPVVATPVGFAPDLISDGENGYLVERDSATIGAYLHELTQRDLSEWRARARNTAEEHGWPAIADRYLDLVANLRDLGSPK